MKTAIGVLAFALLLIACSDSASSVLEEGGEASANVVRIEKVAYHVTGMKKAASGAI